ncbi:hemopexin isoform X1 [Podarcis muralis]
MQKSQIQSPKAEVSQTLHLKSCCQPVGHGSSKFNGTGGSSWHHSASQPPLNDTETARRCANEEGFDAITLDERGNMLFFKGDVVWKGFSGPAEPLNASWPQIQGPLDAALRIHHLDQPVAHDNVYLFQGLWVWAYAQGKLRPGFPRRIEEEFRGVPGPLDAAVECHPKECAAATVLFFKGPLVFSYDLATGMVKQRSWPAVANCSSAVRWLERYYCFQGIQFLRFDPVTGEVPPKYPRDARDYFMRCPGRGHGHEAQANATLRAAMDPCSGEPFQAFSSDDLGRIYAFRGGQYLRVDSWRDGWHAWPLSHTWKGLEGDVDAAFSWEDKFYLIQGSEVTIFRAGSGYSRVEGYPRPLQEELGLPGVDAAFTCPQASDLYVFQGNSMKLVDLQRSPRLPGPALATPHHHVDSAFCTAQGVFLFQGPNFYHYRSVDHLLGAPGPVPAQNTAADVFWCPMARGKGASPRPTPQT